MIKRLLTSVILVFFALQAVTGCSRKPKEELSWGKYIEIKQELYKIDGEILVACSYSRYNHDLILKLPQILIWDVKYNVMKKVKTICRAKGVRFQDYNRAHQRFGPQKIKYTEQLNRFLFLARYYVDAIDHPLTHSFRYFCAEPGQDNRFPMLAISNDTIIPLGKPLIDPWDDPELARWIPVDPYYFSRVDLMFAPQTQASSLFTAADSLISLSFVGLNISGNSLEPIRMGFYPLVPLSQIDSLLSFSNLTVFIKIDASGDLALNSEVVDSRKELVSLVEKLLNRSEKRIAVVAVSEETFCDEIVDFCKVLDEYEANILLIPEGLIAPNEPHLNTREILTNYPLLSMEQGYVTFLDDAYKCRRKYIIIDTVTILLILVLLKIITPF